MVLSSISWAAAGILDVSVKAIPVSHQPDIYLLPELLQQAVLG